MQKQILLTISLEELAQLIRENVRIELNVRNKEPPKPAPEFIGTKDAASILKISLPTLRKYTRLGLIKGYKTGNITRYRRDEMEKAMRSIQTFKHSRNENH